MAEEVHTVRVHHEPGSVTEHRGAARRAGGGW